MLEINQRIELDVKSGDYEGLYVSRVEEINEDNILIGLPFDKGVPIPLNLRTLVGVNVVGKDAVYTATAFVVGRMREPIPMLILNYPLQFKRLQRRDYVRVDTSLDVEILSSDQQKAHVKGTTMNVSGGGLRFSLDKKFQELYQIQKDSLLEICLVLPENLRIGGLLQVVRMDELEVDSEVKKFIIGGKFIAIDEKEREKIIGYVFQKQRALKKMGLL